MIKENVAEVESRIQAACERAGRKREEVTLIAVSKTKPVSDIYEVIETGIKDYGENKVQEMCNKIETIKEPLNWHMIGHLQTNKVKYIIDKVSMIHSVDSYKLAEEINKRAGQHGITMDILIQVNSAQEESKFGISTDETEELIRRILENCPNIKIRGLMCIAPFAEDPNDIRVYFAEVKKLYDQYSQIEHERLDFQYLSMGMSHDFEVAILEGSNLIRVGTAIFGERDYSKQK